MPDFIVLPRQAENQIGHDHGIQPAQLFQIGGRFFAAVFAPQTAADGGIESLHADGNAVYARIDAGLCLAISKWLMRPSSVNSQSSANGR